MKLYRFVGQKEVESLLNGEKQFNDFDWSVCCDTNSKGICFFAYNRTNNIDLIIENVLENWGFSGIVKEYAIIEINVDKARKAHGFYSGGMRTEYNLFEYSLKDVINIWTIPHRTIKYSNGRTYDLRDTETSATNIYRK